MKSLNTFYDTLQVSRNATIAALRTAHKTLSERLQPGRNPEDPAAARQLLQVNKALEVLTHPHAREAYDAWLGQRIGDVDDVGVPTLPELPELPERPGPANGSTKVSSEALAPLPTLDLDGFVAEVAAKAKASASTPAAAAPAPTPTPTPLIGPVAKPTATALPAAKPAAPPPAPKPASAPSGFAETQPYHPSDGDDLPDLEAPNRKAAATTPTRPAASQRTAAQRSAPLKALDWLRERPLALVAAVLLCVLLVAFAPWLWHAAFGARRSEVPTTPGLQTTYVEPPAVAVSAPAAAAELVEAVEEPVAQPPTESKRVPKAKLRNVPKRVAEPKRAQVPIAPVQQPEPVVAPPPVDPGGHTGFAPKCRWVTPTNWSCK